MNIENSPFSLENSELYEAWKAQKLSNFPKSPEELIVPLQDPFNLSDDEKNALLKNCAMANMAIYKTNLGADPNKELPMKILRQLGQTKMMDRNPSADENGVTTLSTSTESEEGFIPYSTKGIHWHTDGYYNAMDRQILSMVLHCVQSAEVGGENALLDHEILYIFMRDGNPEHIRALMAPDVMTVPPHIVNGVEKRPARTGPVFSINQDGTLHMRYTARKVNIQWKDDPLVESAVGEINRILHEPLSYIFRLTLQPGWGLVCNNVLHDRSAFQDPPGQTLPRTLYRIRSYDRIPASL